MLDVKKVFNGIFFANLAAAIAVLIQIQTGHEVADPKVQVAILAIVNLLVRFFTGNPKPGLKDIWNALLALIKIKDAVKPVKGAPADAKPFYESKVFWTSVVALIVSAVQNATGWVIPPDAVLYAYTAIAFLLSLITHKPVTLR